MMVLSTECLHSLAQQWTLDKELSQERDFRFYQGWLTLPVAFIGLFLNSFFVASVIRVVQEHRVSRKFYVLLLNRAAGDVLACLIHLPLVDM
uniref:G-protein coupled receptors family 1 profile domain-containing protein n=1 Tax=Ditylenchus dipsaci TaxID=166011 RepID=A0A915EM80_9BILA